MNSKTKHVSGKPILLVHFYRKATCLHFIQTRHNLSLELTLTFSKQSVIVKVNKFVFIYLKVDGFHVYGMRSHVAWTQMRPCGLLRGAHSTS